MYPCIDNSPGWKIGWDYNSLDDSDNVEPACPLSHLLDVWFQAVSVTVCDTGTAWLEMPVAFELNTWIPIALTLWYIRMYLRHAQK